MCRSGAAATIFSGGAGAKVAAEANTGPGTASKNGVPLVFSLVLDADWTRAGGQPCRQQSWRQPVPVSW